MWLTWPDVQAAPVRWSAWLGFAYAALFSMWIGFFAWYRGLALGGVVRVSQVQLLQPFLTFVFSAVLIGARLEPSMFVAAGLVIVTIAIGRRG
jgi:drug/metabolite transporter (DMT)-like permease